MEISLEDYVDHVVDLAKAVEAEDPIDWGMLEVDEDSAYRLVALSVVNQFAKYDESERTTMIATIVKMVVENFVLNIKLQKDKNGNPIL